jgi:hypothetical protein
MENISCSICYLIRYLKLASTPEGTDWKLSEKNKKKKQKEDTVQVKIPKCCKTEENCRET